jgi:hypothetical protein
MAAGEMRELIDADGRPPMPTVRAYRAMITALGGVIAVVVVAGSAGSPFMAENDVAMTKMMAAMHIAASGDADADFVAMMVPHHQGAIDMAQAELRYGRNEQVRRIAQEIIVTQLQEIEAMQRALGRPPSATAPACRSHPPGVQE